MAEHDKETESIDRLFLELSQFTRATTAKELAAQKDSRRLALLLDWWFGIKTASADLRQALTPEELVQMLDNELAKDQTNG